jgi:DNA modification methylase
MKFKIANNDIRKWIDDYQGEKFHALLSDPPYNLESISKRFGKKGSVPAKHGKDGAFARTGKGFMGKDWDSQVAFDTELWIKIKDILYPGAFCLCFMGRNYHRLATAVEDAGFIIHPLIAWVQSQGFPKATRIDTQIDRMNGAKREVIGKLENPTSNNRQVYQKGWAENPDVTAPATDDAKMWEGYRYGLQALKPCMEPIVMFQKPYEGKPVLNIMKTGAGALNIAETKFSKDREFAVNRFDSGMKPFGNGAGHSYKTEVENKLYPANVIIDEGVGEPFANFFYQAKASKKEKDAGLEDGNKHPTIKPLELTKYLATLLLPPVKYDTRLLVPFSGTGSEVIGGLTAGWDFVYGVELEEESYKTSLKRIEYWT